MGVISEKIGPAIEGKVKANVINLPTKLCTKKHRTHVHKPVDMWITFVYNPLDMGSEKVKPQNKVDKFKGGIEIPWRTINNNQDSKYAFY